MEIQRLGVKFFVVDPLPPSAGRPLSKGESSVRALVPVFHTWIQKQNVEGHLLIDVHDYSHIHHGPGILLVGHEGNFSLDMADGKPGLLYYRKQPLTGSPEDRFETIVKTALQACKLLEENPYRFRTDEILIVANDRLHAPNNEATFTQLAPVFASVLQKTLGLDFKFNPLDINSGERFAVLGSQMRR